MKKLLVIGLFVLFACNPAHDSEKRGAGLNLGKQAAAVTLPTGSTNNLTIPGNSPTTFVRVIANASGSTLSGVDSSGAGDGDLIFIRNEAAAGSVTITDSDTNSLTANRFKTPGGTGAVIGPGKSAAFEWDSTAGAWMLVIGGGAGTEVVQGKVRTSGTAPVLSSCGTSPTIVGNDYSGRYTTGGGATTCTITFSSTYGNVPSCVLGVEGGATMPTYTVSATAITVSVDIASTTYNYICIGH